MSQLPYETVKIELLNAKIDTIGPDNYSILFLLFSSQPKYVQIMCITYESLSSRKPAQIHNILFGKFSL